MERASSVNVKDIRPKNTVLLIILSSIHVETDPHKTKSMWIRTYSKTFQNVTKEALWELWTDVNQWPAWHRDLEFCTLNGPFEVGNYFILKPKGIRPIKIILTKIEKGRKFTDYTSFFGAKMCYTQKLRKQATGA